MKVRTANTIYEILELPDGTCQFGRYPKEASEPDTATRFWEKGKVLTLEEGKPMVIERLSDGEQIVTTPVERIEP